MTVPGLRQGLTEELAGFAEMITAFSAGGLAGPAAQAKDSEACPRTCPRRWPRRDCGRSGSASSMAAAARTCCRCSSPAGCAVGQPIGRIGLRGLVRHPVTFSRLRLPDAATVPADREQARSTRLLLLAAVACGIAESALTAARDYTGARKQFGRLLIEFPAVAELLGSMTAELADCLDRLTKATGAPKRTSLLAQDLSLSFNLRVRAVP